MEILGLDKIKTEFLKEAIEHNKALLDGDYKKANKLHIRLIKTNPEQSIKCLNDSAERSAVVSNTADLVIRGWKNGDLL